MTASDRNLIKPEAKRPCLTLPEVDIRICMGTGGVAAGSREVKTAFEEEIKRAGVMAFIRPREDKCADRAAAVTGTGCQGLCAMDPLVEIHLRRNGKYTKHTYGQVTPKMVPEIFEKHVIGGEPIEKWLVLSDEDKTEYNAFYDSQQKLTLRHVGVIDPEDIDDYLEAGGYQALYKVLSTHDPGRGDRGAEGFGLARSRRGGLLYGTEVAICGRLRFARRSQVLHL